MKYLKVFKTDEERQEFEKTIDCWPIITLTTYNQEISGSLNYYDEGDVVVNNTIKFPVYLETGTKTKIGADLYKYIIDNNIRGLIFNNETIIIYVDNIRVLSINIFNNQIIFTDGGVIFDYLYPDGNLICNCFPEF